MTEPRTEAHGSTSYLLFVACSPGLEELLRAELGEWGLAGRIRPGGVELRSDRVGLWTACLYSRLAESVRVRLKPFVAKDFAALEHELERLPWRAYLPRGSPVEVRVTCRASRLWHSDAVAERIARVLFERAGVTVDPAAPQKVYARLERDRVQVSIDAGGERLHRRGYRKHVVEASLRETLAAALVRSAESIAGETGVLWDPFCGAGTLALEWLEAKLGRIAGVRRRFAFESWPTHDATAYAAWLESLPRVPVASNGKKWLAIGSDRAERAIAAARANAARAELTSSCRWLVGDFEQVVEEIPQGALVLSNPPYGVRARKIDRRGTVLDRLGRLLERRRDLRPVILLLPRGEQLEVAGVRLSELFRTSNGGLAVWAQALEAG